MCRCRGAGRHRLHRGFSLIELVVVLLLLGLISGIAVPRLASLFDGLQSKNQINEIRQAIQNAPLHAYVSGENIDLAEYLAEMAVVPEDWQLVFPASVVIRSNGVCLGGSMKLLMNGREHNYLVLAPLCRLESA